MTNQRDLQFKQAEQAIALTTNRLGSILSVMKEMVVFDNAVSEIKKQQIVALLDTVVLGFIQINNIAGSLIPRESIELTREEKEAILMKEEDKKEDSTETLARHTGP